MSIRTRGEREEGVMRDGYTDKHHLNLDKKKNLKLHHVSYYIKRETHVGEEPPLSRWLTLCVFLATASRFHLLARKTSKYNPVLQASNVIRQSRSPQCKKWNILNCVCVATCSCLDLLHQLQVNSLCPAETLLTRHLRSWEGIVSCGECYAQKS